MAEVIEPSYSPDKDPADAAWENQITRATNNIQYQVDNISESVGDTASVIPIYSNTQDGNTQSYTPPINGTGFVTFHAYTGGELPTLPISGLVFSQYSDQPVDLVIYQYRRTSTKPTNPGTTSYNVSTGAWTATTNWQKTLPAQDNVPTWVSQANIVGSGVIVAAWSNPVLLYQADIAEGFVFYGPSSSSNPGTPSASDFNFETGAFTNLTNNWQRAPVTVGNGTTGQAQWQSRFRAELPVGQTTAVITFQTPTSFTAFGNNIQSDNFNGDLSNIFGSPGTAGWGISRSSGNAIFSNVNIRGTSQVEAARVTGALTAATISANSISAGTINASNVNLTNLNASNITTGNLTATNVNFGVIMQVVHGSFNSTTSNFASITATNNTNFNTFLVVMANVTCTSGESNENSDGSRDASSAGASFSLTGTGVSLSSSVGVTNSNRNKQDSVTLKSGTLTKGATYTANGNVSGQFNFSGGGNILIFEVKL